MLYYVAKGAVLCACVYNFSQYSSFMVMLMQIRQGTEKRHIKWIFSLVDIWLWSRWVICIIHARNKLIGLNGFLSTCVSTNVCTVFGLFFFPRNVCSFVQAYFLLT